MQTAKFVVLFLIWSAKTKSSVTVKMLNSYKVVTKQKGVRIMRQYMPQSGQKHTQTGFRKIWMQERQSGNAAAISAESQKNRVLKIWRM